MTETATDLAELREILAQHLRSDPARRAKDVRGLLEFCCPVHDDSTPSAHLGDYAWGCKGCSAGGNLMDLASTLGVDVKLTGTPRGYTLEDYAAEKSFALDNLQRWGLTTEESRGAPVLMIPYYASDGTLMRRRMRVSKRKGHADKFWEGQGGSIPGAYGLWIVAKTDVTHPVVIVEGESDCHALWSHSVPAVGLPGAETWRHCREALLPLLAGRTVYVWEEPDAAGAAMLRDVAADIPDARVLRLDGVKDPCKLRQNDPAQFRETMRRLMRDALPIGTPKPPIVFDALDRATLERMAEEKSRICDAVPSGFALWDQCCGDEGGEIGPAHGWHVVIGGATNTRKSLFALNVFSAAVHCGERAAWLSLEMSQIQNVTRALGVMTGLPVREMQHGQHFRPETWAAAADYMEELQADTGGLAHFNREYISTLEDVERSVLYLYEYLGVRTFVVDYMQLAYVKNAKDQIDRVTETSKMLFGLSHRHRLRTFGLSQITREASNLMATPRPSNCIGGSAIENDADQVVMMDHSRDRRSSCSGLMVDGVQGRMPVFSREGVAVLSKNRHGPKPIDIPVFFDANNLRITQRDTLEGQEW